MKKIIYLLVTVILISGCRSVGTSHNVMKNVVENSRRVSEKKFNYAYKDVFLAIIQLMNDNLQAIYEKDFDKGIILVDWLQHKELAVGCSYGFWLEKINNNETKVILRIDERNAQGGGYLIGLTVEDLFNRIKKELEIQEELRK